MKNLNILLAIILILLVSTSIGATIVAQPQMLILVYMSIALLSILATYVASAYVILKLKN